LYKNNSNPRHTLFEATSDLKKQLIDFITIQELKKNEAHQNFLLLEALKSRKLDRLFFKESERIQEEWDDDSVPGIEHFHNQYKLKLLIFSHPNFDNSKVALEDSIDLLEQYYFTAMMYFSLIYNVNYNRKNTTDYSIPKLIQNYKLTSFTKKIKTKLLFDFLSAYQSNNIESFHLVKSTFFKLQNNFIQSEKHDIVDILNYFFYSKRNDFDINKALFEISKFALKEGLFLEDGYITKQSFLNCVIIGQDNKEIDWIKKFIIEYKPFLNEEKKIDLVLYGESIIAFEKKEFDISLSKISQVRMRGAYNVVRINFIRLQCYYELNLEDPFYSLVHSTKQYLLNHKQEFTKENFFMINELVNIISQTKKIKGELKYSIDLNNNQKKTKKMLEKLSKYGHTSNVRWLTIKLNELTINFSQ